jgi:hypothetical protein
MDAASNLTEATRRYLRTKKAHEEARDAAEQAVVEALRTGMRPTDVTAAAPFTAAYVRRIAREHGIEPATPGPKRATDS